MRGQAKLIYLVLGTSEAMLCEVAQRALSKEERSHPRVEALHDPTPQSTLRRGVRNGSEFLVKCVSRHWKTLCECQDDS